MIFSLKILGVNSAVPAHGRVPTSQVLRAHNHCFLIDCGEGAQIRMSQFGVGRGMIDRVFISHLHGDHIFGLPGWLYSLSLFRRTKPLHIHAPQAHLLKNMLDNLLAIQGELGYEIHYYDAQVEPGNSLIVYEDEALTVQSIPLLHRVPTVGYVFREKPRLPNIIPEKIQAYKLSVDQILLAKNGHMVELSDGTLLHPSELTLPPPPPRSYAYLSDTAYTESVLPFIQGVDLLYHEATFAHELLEHAKLTMHSTAAEAATIASKAGVGTLILGHYSSRYQDLSILLEEARSIFPNTVLGEEGREYQVPFRSARKTHERLP
ncbi:MAG: ribonuclease Z [Saprospiraceae bacterium]|nr:MAG: ribonuclease Z [Saprospiraceae bacterium]GIV31388.1 MAG: ribonuclease Z [Saprospiraceae bacterium]